MGSVDLLLREAEAHEYFAENADLRMTTGDHAKRAANIRAIAAALREQPEARGVVDGEALQKARDEGFNNAICYVLGYFNGTGDRGSTAYEEILKGAGQDKIVAYARKHGEMRFTGLDKYTIRQRRLRHG